MKKVNIFIARRSRQEHLENCLHYLSEANSRRLYNVLVVVNSDSFSDKWVEPEHFPNLSLLQSNSIENHNAFFNKAKLLNECIRMAGGQREADWFSVVDADMLYPPHWFELMEQKLNQWDYVVCHGWKLNSRTQNRVNKRPSFEELKTLPKIDFPSGPSQVTMNYKCLKTLTDAFGWPLYDEKFEGWGGEDSILSSMSRKLQLHRWIAKTELQEIWLHQWHPAAEPSQKNIEYFLKRDAEIEAWK